MLLDRNIYLYPRSGVSCNRCGNFGWNPFFNLLKYSLLELQTDRRRPNFIHSSIAQKLMESSWPSQISSKVKIISHSHSAYVILARKIFKCACVLWCLGFAQSSRYSSVATVLRRATDLLRPELLSWACFNYYLRHSVSKLHCICILQLTTTLELVYCISYNYGRLYNTLDHSQSEEVAHSSQSIIHSCGA